MKKMIYTFAIFMSTHVLFAQEAEDKKVQAGIVAGIGVNFQKSATKYMEPNGIGKDLTVGANVVFNFNHSLGFCTGLEFDFATLNYKPTNYNGFATFYNYADSKILQKEDVDGGNTGTLFVLQERKQKATYISVPTMLVFRTKFIGYFRYFGKFGLRNSFLVSQKSIDTGYDFVNTDGNAAKDMDNMKQKNDMFFYKGAAGIAGGAEWNFTGTTTLVAELGYYYNFVPLSITSKDKNMSLRTTDAGLNNIYFANKATQGQLMFKLSILF